MTDEETLLAAGFGAEEARNIVNDLPGAREYAEYVLRHGAGPEDERALAVVRRLLGRAWE